MRELYVKETSDYPYFVKTVGFILKFIFILLGTICCAINIVNVSLYIHYKVKKSKKQEVTESTTWMTNKINRDIPLNALTIPGSHDTLTYDWCDVLNPYQIMTSLWAQTQHLNVYDQLLCGCRYFDLRITWDGSDKKWYGIHGNFVNKNVSYEDVLKQLQVFCNTYPKEVIIWRLSVQKSGSLFPAELHKTYLESMLIPYTYNLYSMNPYDDPAFNMSINDLNKNGRQVILVNQSTRWNNYIEDPYTESKGAINTPSKGVEVLSDIYSNKRYSGGILPVLQWINVYNTDTISSIFYPIFYHANNLNKAFSDWNLPPPPKRDKMFIYKTKQVQYTVPPGQGLYQINEDSTYPLTMTSTTKYVSAEVTPGYGVIKFDFLTEEYCRLIWQRNLNIIQERKPELS